MSTPRLLLTILTRGQELLDDVVEGQAGIPLGRVYRFDQIVQAHHEMEAGAVSGKGVVLT